MFIYTDIQHWIQLLLLYVGGAHLTFFIRHNGKVKYTKQRVLNLIPTVLVVDGCACDLHSCAY